MSQKNTVKYLILLLIFVLVILLKFRTNKILDKTKNNIKIYVESSDNKPTKTNFTIKSLGNGYYSISYGSKYFTTNTSNGGILKGATFSSSNLKQRFKFVLADY